MRGRDPITKERREFCRGHTALAEAWGGFHVMPWALKEPVTVSTEIPPPPPPAAPGTGS